VRCIRCLFCNEERVRVFLLFFKLRSCFSFRQILAFFFAFIFCFVFFSCFELLLYVVVVVCIAFFVVVVVVKIVVPSPSD